MGTSALRSQNGKPSTRAEAPSAKRFRVPQGAEHSDTGISILQGRQNAIRNSPNARQFRNPPRCAIRHA
eukprot:2135902-Alexandrium_andersonii.AAC.1